MAPTKKQELSLNDCLNLIKVKIEKHPRTSENFDAKRMHEALCEVKQMCEYEQELEGEFSTDGSKLAKQIKNRMKEVLNETMS